MENQKGFTITLGICAIFALVLILLCGCSSTVTHYDKDGNITRVEKTTDAAKLYDCTKDKSQLVLIDALYIKSDITATAGEAYMPGWTISFVNGKSAVINAKDNCNFKGASDIIDGFFTSIEASKDGIKTGK